MPPAVAAIVPGLAGAGASSASGKKGGGSAQRSADAQAQLQNQLFGEHTSTFTPAANYFKSLLSGDPRQIAAAVGPTSDILKQQAQANQQALAANTVGGGAQNQAQQQNLQNQYNQTSRLYAGVQPAAAQALGQLSQAPLSASAPNIGAGLKYNTHLQDQSNQAKGGLGTGLGQAFAGARNSKRSGEGGGGGGGKGGGSNPTGALAPGFSQNPTEGYT